MLTCTSKVYAQYKRKIIPTKNSLSYKFRRNNQENFDNHKLRFKFSTITLKQNWKKHQKNLNSTNNGSMR